MTSHLLMLYLRIERDTEVIVGYFMALPRIWLEMREPHNRNGQASSGVEPLTFQISHTHYRYDWQISQVTPLQFLTHHRHHRRHHMALHPNSEPGLPWKLGFRNHNPFTGFELLVQRPTTNLEDQASVFITPGERVAQLYPQVPGTHFKGGPAIPPGTGYPF
jgi:hypothetical protein